MPVDHSPYVHVMLETRLCSHHGVFVMGSKISVELCCVYCSTLVFPSFFKYFLVVQSFKKCLFYSVFKILKKLKEIH